MSRQRGVMENCITIRSRLLPLMWLACCAVMLGMAPHAASARDAAAPSDTGQHTVPPLFVSTESPDDQNIALYQSIVGTGEAASTENGASNAGAEPDDYRPVPFVLSESARRAGPAVRRGVAVSPVQFAAASGSTYDRALDCMTMAIAYEAGNQTMAGLESVGQVILNRTRAGRFPRSVCGVVFQGADRITGCQFTFACDGSLHRHLKDDTMTRARAAAAAVLTGASADHVAGATHYHADYVQPYWASTGTRVTKIGAHIFYRMPGDTSASSAAVALIDEPELALARYGLPARPIQPTVLAEAQHTIFAPWGLPLARAGQSTGVPQR